MKTYEDLINFFELLDQLDSVDCEEGKNVEQPYSLVDLWKANSGNNCLHFVFTYNNHRIVIQTYKNPKMDHDGIDIVQGSVASEDIFSQIVSCLQNLSDGNINRLLEFYFWYAYYCSAMYHGAEDSICCEFGPNIEVWHNNEDSFRITADNASVEECSRVSTFIEWAGFFLLHFLCDAKVYNG